MENTNQTESRDNCTGLRPMVTDMPPGYYDKIKETTITQLDRGYIVRVGCQTFAIATKEELISKLVQYISNPGETEQLYNNKKLF